MVDALFILAPSSLAIPMQFFKQWNTLSSPVVDAYLTTAWPTYPRILKIFQYGLRFICDPIFFSDMTKIFIESGKYDLIFSDIENSFYSQSTEKYIWTELDQQNLVANITELDSFPLQRCASRESPSSEL